MYTVLSSQMSRQKFRESNVEISKELIWRIFLARENFSFYHFTFSRFSNKNSVKSMLYFIQWIIMLVDIF